MSLAFSDVIAIYGALAAVCAITTAIQGALAVIPLPQIGDIENRKRNSGQGLAPYTDAKNDAKQLAKSNAILNTGAVITNAAVLCSWGYVSIVLVGASKWYLWLPFVSIAFTWFFMAVVSIYGCVKLKLLSR
jgi:hypothetical protein